MEEKYLCKLQIASVRFGDLIYGFFAGQHNATLMDNARAVSDLLKGIRDNLQKKKLIGNLRLKYEDPANHEIKRISNFVKHADRDPSSQIKIQNLYTRMAVSNAADDYATLVDEMYSQGLIDESVIRANWIEAPNGLTECGFAGNKVTLLAKMFFVWKRDHFSQELALENLSKLIEVNNVMEKQSGHILSQIDAAIQQGRTLKLSPEEDENLKKSARSIIKIVEGMRTLLNGDDEKQNFLDIIHHMKLWPIEPDGGIAINPNSGILKPQRDYDLL